MGKFRPGGNGDDDFWHNGFAGFLVSWLRLYTFMFFFSETLAGDFNFFICEVRAFNQLLVGEIETL